MSIGILVHPGWVSRNIEELYNIYVDKLKEYDKRYVLLPYLSIEARKEFLKNNKTVIIDMLVDDTSGFTDTGLDINAVLNIDLLKELTYKTYKRYLNNIKTKSTKLGKIRLNKTYRQVTSTHYAVLSKLYSEECEECFVGSLSFIPGIKKMIEGMVSEPSFNTVSAGGITYSLQAVIYHFEQIGVSKDSVIEVFGEYYNQCVKYTHDALTNCGYRDVKRLPEFSTYGILDDGIDECAHEQYLKRVKVGGSNV